jgi:hypothetical protein
MRRQFRFAAMEDVEAYWEGEAKSSWRVRRFRFGGELCDEVRREGFSRFFSKRFLVEVFRVFVQSLEFLRSNRVGGQQD